MEISFFLIYLEDLRIFVFEEIDNLFVKKKTKIINVQPFLLMISYYCNCIKIVKDHMKTKIPRRI